jgi:uncharacterized membrane protein
VGTTVTGVVLVSSLAAVVVLGTSAGVHVSGVTALNPALRALDAPAYVVAKQSADQHFPVLMRPLTLAGVVALLVQTVSGALAGEEVVALLGGVGLAAALVALAAVLRGDLPINERMAGWAADDVPVDWTRWRERWERFFLARTLATLGAFAAALAGLTVLT